MPALSHGDLKSRIPFTSSPPLIQPGQTMWIRCSGGTEFMEVIISDLRIWKPTLTNLEGRPHRSECAAHFPHDFNTAKQQTRLPAIALDNAATYD
ncbi:MAG: hypothetical protein O3B01_29145 [Planctomycetota bacterium]|nr:hypothetical protein [Planctomycetota bacterium]